MTPSQNILAVDDDKFFTSYAGKLVSDYGHHLEVCNDPSLLDLDSLTNYDLILLDVVMPGINGISMLDKILQHSPGIGVILMTSVDRGLANGIANMAINIGINWKGTLHKPFDRMDLYRLLGTGDTGVNNSISHSIAPASISADVLNAALRGQYAVWLQPQLSLTTKAWVGCQGTAVHPSNRHNVVVPSEPFIDGAYHPVMPDYFLGLIKKATAEIAQVNLATRKRLSLTVAVPASALCEDEFVTAVIQTMEQANICPQQLVIELASHGNNVRPLLPRAFKALGRLQRTGIRISTTVAEYDLAKSAELLDAASFSEIKLDSMLVSKLGTNQVVAQGVAALLDELEHRCIASIADGISDANTEGWLSTHGCNIGQGSFIAAPLALHDLLSWHQTKEGGKQRYH